MVSNVPVGSPEYGMTNGSNFRWGISLSATPCPKTNVRRRHLFMGMKPQLKTVSNLPLGFPVHGMTNGSSFRWRLPHASNPQRVRKRGIHLMMQTLLHP